MRILVNHNGQQLGPYTMEEVRAALQSGALAPSDLAWVEGTPSWVPLASLVAGPAPGLPPNLPGAAAPFAAPHAAASTSGFAVASLILGIVSWVLCLNFLTGIPAIICGHIARSRIHRAPGQFQGAGIALAGLILGYMTVATLPFALAGAIPAYSAARERALEVQSMNNARAITMACTQYAADHAGVFPDTLETLVPKYLPDGKQLSCPMQKQPGATGYDYFLASKKEPAPDEVVLASKVANRKGQRVVAHGNLMVQMEAFQPPAGGELSH